ncbi:MAG: single-stranded DNA-binding protein [Bacillota bacterium]|nr:single-stranded DNA-binding protein [Bacillota bacterium]
MNSVHLIGRLTQDPEVLYGAKTKNAYCRFAVAVDRGRGKDGEDLGADFPMVVAFGKTAENMKKYVEKGNLVCVDGVLRTDRYEKDGHVRYKDNVIANRVQFLQWKKTEDGKEQEAPKVEAPEGFTQLTDDDIPF